MDGLQDLTITVGGELGPLKQTLDQIGPMARAAGEAAAQAMQAATAGGDAADAAFTRAAYASRALADAMATTTGAALDLDRELQNKQADAGNAAAAFQNLGTQLTEAGGAMIIIGTALSAVSAGIVAMGTEALEASAKIETQRISMVNLTKSASETDALIKQLIDFAVKTPFQIPGVIEMGQKLIAMGTATSDVIPLLRTLGDTASGSGKGFAGLNTLVNDFGKMAQLGTVHMRELNTLAYQGVPAIQALADAFGVSTNRMRQMIEQNLVASTDAMPILLKTMTEKFGGMMEAQSKGLEGMFSNLKDTVIKTLIAIGDALAPAAKGVINALMPILESIQKLAEGFGTLPPWVQQTAIVLGVLAVAIGPIVLGIGGLIFVVGQVIIAAQTLAPIVGIELPAAFTRGTIATVANTEALAANAIAAKASGAALATNVVEGAGAAGTAFGLLKTAAGFAATALGAVAVAFISGKLIASILETIPAVGKLTYALAEENGQITQAIAMGGVGYVKAMGEANAAAQAAAGGINLAATSLKKLQDAQSDANQALKVAKETLDLAKSALDGTKEKTDIYTRAVNDYNEALKKANPAIKEHGQALRDASNYVNDASKAIDSYSGIIQKFPGYVTNSMSQFRKAIIDGFNPDTAIKGIDTLITQMEALAAAGDENAKSISEFFQKGRKDIIDMLLSLDPTKMQQFDINGVQVLKGGISALGASASDMAAKLAKALNITEDAAAKLVNAWKIGMRDAQQATDGFTSTVVNGVTMITPYTEAVKKHGDASSQAAGQVTTMSQAMDLVNQRALIGSDNLGKITLGVQQLITQQANLDNEARIAKGVLDDLNERYKSGSVAVQVLQKALENYKSAAAAAAGATRAFGDSIYDLEGNLKSSGGAMYDAIGNLNAFASASDKMKGSFMEGMNGMTASGETFIAMLAQLGATWDVLDKAAEAFGYKAFGINNYLNKEGAAKLFGQDAADKLFATRDEWFKAMADFADSMKGTTNAVSDLGTSATKTATDIPKVYQPLKDTVDAVAKPLVELADVTTKTAGAIGKVYQTLDTTGAVMKGTAEMWREFPEEMGKAQGQTIQNMIDLGVNFYDASAAVNRFADAAVDSANLIRSTAGTVAGEASNQTDFAKQVMAMAQKDMADYLADPMSKRDMSATSSTAGTGTDTPFAKAMLAAAQADMAAYLAQSTNTPRPGGGLVNTGYSYGLPNYNVGRTLNSPASPQVGLGGTATGMEAVPNTPAISLTFTGNNIMDDRTMNGLANTVMSKVVGVLQKAGLKVQ